MNLKLPDVLSSHRAEVTAKYSEPVSKTTVKSCGGVPIEMSPKSARRGGAERCADRECHAERRARAVGECAAREKCALPRRRSAR